MEFHVIWLRRFIVRFARCWIGMSCLGLAACTGVQSPVPPAPVSASPKVSASPPTTTPAQAPAPPKVPEVRQRPARDWDEFKQRAAERVVLANPGKSFSGALPDQLRSIPVLLVELNRDGSVRHVSVLRKPKFSPESQAMAMEAIRRAGPFESVAHLPQPWQYSETFLYNDDLKFQLRTLAVVP